jgi:hypothetical protein
MKYFTRESYREHFSEKGSSLLASVALIAILLPLALPVLIEIHAEPVSSDKPSKYSAALALAEVGLEKAILGMNNGDITTWEGDHSLRILLLSRVPIPGGEETGDIEIRVKWPYEKYTVVEATGRVSYTSAMNGGATARFIVERKAKTVLERKGTRWTSLFPEAQESAQVAAKSIF